MHSPHPSVAYAAASKDYFLLFNSTFFFFCLLSSDWLWSLSLRLLSYSFFFPLPSLSWCFSSQFVEDRDTAVGLNGCSTWIWIWIRWWKNYKTLRKGEESKIVQMALSLRNYVMSREMSVWKKFVTLSISYVHNTGAGCQGNNPQFLVSSEERLTNVG